MADEDRLKTWESLFAKALKAIDSIREPAFNSQIWSFGGGTVLMRRYRHRYSKDVDIFVPDAQYLGYVDPDLNDAIGELTSQHVRQENFVRLHFDEGEVDFIAAAPVTDNPRVLEQVLGRAIQVDTSIEIVGKKIKYRAAEFTARDIFDFALVAEKEPKDLPKIRSVLDERSDAILERLASGDRALRTTFEALDTLDYKPSYDHCLTILKKAIEE